MEDMLMLAYAREIARKLPDVIRLHCMGCNLMDFETQQLYDHPSQLRHNVCIMMSQEDQVDLCFDDTLHLVEGSQDLLTCWESLIESLEPPATGIEKLKYQCIHWRTSFMTEEVKKDIKLMVLDCLSSNILS